MQEKMKETKVNMEEGKKGRRERDDERNKRHGVGGGRR